MDRTIPIRDPINWDLQGCTPGQNGGPAGSPGPQYLSVRKTDGPTTAAGDVCAHVTIQLDQKIALTRNAFKGSLVIDDSDSNDLTSVLVALNIVDDNGELRQRPLWHSTAHLDRRFRRRWLGRSSRATLLGPSNIPLCPRAQLGAAPTLPGSLSRGRHAQLHAIRQRCHGDARSAGYLRLSRPGWLSLDYFLQRDVIGDDPVEPGTVTPQPFDLGLMVRNSGYGSALDFTVTSAQPQISENTKGLLINFQLIGTQVGTSDILDSVPDRRSWHARAAKHDGRRLAIDVFAGRPVYLLFGLIPATEPAWFRANFSH